MNVDPLTGKPLPSTAIQRILYLAPKVHIYQIPPATSTKGYQASTWTADNNKLQIFTARLRVVETSIPSNEEQQSNDDAEEKVTTTLLLEDPKTGDLFAAAPYTSERTVEQALDSSRFFAITVVGEQFIDGWRPEGSKDVLEQILTANDNAVDAVMVMNDGMASGVAEALEEQGLDIPMSGQDGAPGALNLIARGQQTFTIWKNSYELGAAAADTV